MLLILCAAAALSAVAAIIAEGNGRRHRSFYLLKPLTTLLIAGIALLAPEGAYRNWILLGLLLSCMGDISLMFEGQRWFLGGLSSFLLAHVAFVAAYLAGVAQWTPPLWAALFAVYGVAFFAWLMPHTGKLKIPVLVYGAVLMAMAAAAAARWVELGSDAALLALIGAVIFIVSDSALAVRQFRGRYPGAQPLILSTYWSAIGLIAVSAVI
jgi:alkenylglycerophosphocholine hydrolase